MKLRNILLWIVIIVSLVLPRFHHIERPITVDELTWITFSADFYYGFAQKDFERTYQDHHPGVTTMWAGTVSYLNEYPGYRGQGQGYMENDTFKLINFLDNKGVDIFNILITARKLMTAACIFGLIIGAIYLWRLLGPIPAFITIMFISIDPMIMGQTRLYSHEGLMSVLVCLTWISFFDYFRRGHHWISLLISGLAAGLAVATKITALGLIPTVCIFWLFEFKKTQPGKTSTSFYSHLWWSLWPLLLWGLILVITFITIWPATWSNPAETIIFMINHTRGFGAGDNILQWNLILRNVLDYISSIWSHPTLLTWTGVIFYLAALFFPDHIKPNKQMTELGKFPIFYAFIVFLTISIFVTNIQGIRYMTSVHIFLALIGGLGFALFLEWLGSIPVLRNLQWIPALMITLILVSQILIIFPATPYYYTYNNHLRVNPWWGAHGAFLDKAGDYLAAKPNAEKLTAMTYSPGSIMFFFPGKTHMIVPTQEWDKRDVELLKQSDYLVIDYILRYRDTPPRVITDIDWANTLPEYTIGYQGRIFVWIYKVSDLPHEAFIPDPIE